MVKNIKDHKTEIKGKKYYFFLNPYKDYAFTKCPKCKVKTKLRKFALIIHIEPRQPFILNKACRFCTGCDLIIAKQAEIEDLIWVTFKDIGPGIVENKYFVFGTVEKTDWRYLSKGEHTPDEMIERTYVFEDILNFTVAGWYPSDQGK